MTNEAFRAAAVSEIRKYSSGYLYKESRKLVPELNAEDLASFPKSGYSSSACGLAF